ncbi:integrase catalytic domain-containing protein [Nephila pilipes]|uniref:Integrase catalytic domain-containing protein n=1 Tax=Nephila pilipes TaxID=299642 RepID=A0A8X6NMP0_NEPPI|nr:integrase catalytic domain-containing protein [Nephila pilipes]
MVMKKAATGCSKTDLSSLYYELEAKIRPLESLELTEEKFGDFLSLLVEYCLLKEKVKGEEMINFARTGFASPQNPRRKEFQNELLKLAGDSSIASALESLQRPEADNFVEKAQLILSKVCFNLRGWESNVECKHASRNSGDSSVLEIILNLDGDALKTVLRPIQCIYTLEIYSKESVDGELGGEESNSNNVTDNENNVTSSDAVIVRNLHPLEGL